MSYSKLYFQTFHSSKGHRHIDRKFHYISFQIDLDVTTVFATNGDPLAKKARVLFGMTTRMVAQSPPKKEMSNWELNFQNF